MAPHICVPIEDSVGDGWDEPLEWGMRWPPQCEKCGRFMGLAGLRRHELAITPRVKFMYVIDRNHEVINGRGLRA